MTMSKRWRVSVEMRKSDDEIYARTPEEAVEAFVRALAEDHLWMECASFDAEEVADEPD